MCELADLKLGPAAEHDRRVGGRERHARRSVEPPHRLEPTRVEASPPLGLDLDRAGIRTIVWATGFRPDYSVAGRPGARPQGQHPPRWRCGHGVARPVRDGLAASCGAESRASSMAVGDDAEELREHLAGICEAPTRGQFPRADQIIRADGVRAPSQTTNNCSWRFHTTAASRP